MKRKSTRRPLRGLASRRAKHRRGNECCAPEYDRSLVACRHSVQGFIWARRRGNLFPSSKGKHRRKGEGEGDSVVYWSMLEVFSCAWLDEFNKFPNPATESSTKSRNVRELLDASREMELEGEAGSVVCAIFASGYSSHLVYSDTVSSIAFHSTFLALLTGVGVSTKHSLPSAGFATAKKWQRGHLPLTNGCEPLKWCYLWVV